MQIVVMQTTNYMQFHLQCASKSASQPITPTEGQPVHKALLKISYNLVPLFGQPCCQHTEK